MLSVDDILADGGAVAKRLDNYEQRDEQLQMAAGVAESIANKRCLLYTSPSPRDKRQYRMPSSA